jgi:hypothetical protein
MAAAAAPYCKVPLVYARHAMMVATSIL